MINYVTGDIISIIKEGKHEVAIHGCNCFCNMHSGINKLFAENFNASNIDIYGKEAGLYRGDFNKLGCIERGYWWMNNDYNTKHIAIVNCYTQFEVTTDTNKPFSYEAMTMCLVKLNHMFTGKTLVLPKIGTHLGGGEWEKIEELILKYTPTLKVTVVDYGK